MSDRPYAIGRDVAAALNGAAVGRPEPFGSNGLHPVETITPKVFEILTDEEAENLPPTKGILGDLLFEASVAFLYGPSGIWKTFLAVAWGVSIATGREWMGKPVLEGPVVFVTGEGARNVGRRIRAWKRRHGIKGPTRLRVVRKPVHFLSAPDVAGLIQSIKNALGDDRPALIIVDTLALAMAGGNENDTKDAANLMDAANTIREAFECCVLFIHHTGYDTSHMRGNTTLFNNADTVIRVESTERGSNLKPGMSVRIVSEKARDSDPFRPLSVTTELETWTDGDGQRVASLVIVEGDAQLRLPPPSATTPPRDQFTDSAIKAWRTLNKLSNTHHDGVTAGEWETATLKTGNVARTAFMEARSTLVSAGWVRKVGKLYQSSVPGKPLPGSIDFGVLGVDDIGGEQ
jgi:hypothetical protein